MFDSSHFCRLFLATLIYLHGIESIEQQCDFQSVGWWTNSYNGENVIYVWTCNIYSAILSNDDAHAITNTENNTKSNDEVLGFDYSGENITFIPNSIFATFPNLKPVSLIISEIGIPPTVKGAFKNRTKPKAHAYPYG